jgi:nucleoside-diphosphate-sugar epimerase
MKRVLVTGATGFIGSHCIAPLKARGYEVHAAAKGVPAESDDGLVWHDCDLLAPGVAKRLMASIRPTHLLHLAWFVVPGQLITSLENFAWVSASLDLIQEFVRCGGIRVVSSGSAYEYDWSYGYCSEKLTPAVPNTVYGACKRALHLMTEGLASQTGLSAAWGRLFFLYGPNEHPDRLISSVIRSLLTGQPARCSHGRQIRDYMYVQDVADGLASLLDSEATGPFNVCSGQALTIREMVLAAGRISGRSDLVQIGAVQARANDAPLVVGDNSRITAEVGWKPQVELEEGLARTIDWWKKRL